MMPWVKRTLKHGVTVLAVFGLGFCGCAHGPFLTAGLSDSGGWRQSEAAQEEDRDRRVEAYARFATGIIYDLNNDPGQATEHFLRSVMADPSNTPLVVEVSRRLLRNNQLEQAVALLKRAAEETEGDGTIHSFLGLAYTQQGKRDSALEAFQQAVDQAPGSLVAYQNLIHLYIQDGQIERGLERLAQARRANADRAEFLIGLASSMNYIRQLPEEQLGRIQPKVIEILDQAAEMEPEHPTHLFKLAETYKAHGQWKQAAGLFETMQSDYPNMPMVTENLTEIYLHLGESEKARKQLQEVVRNNPMNAQAYYFLGTLDYEAEDYQKAADHFEKALLLKSDFERAYMDLVGLQLGPLQKPEAALEILEKARRQFSASFSLEFYTALAHASLEQYEQALKYFDAAETIAREDNPERLNSYFYFQVGAAQERLQRFEAAEESFRKCLELDPDSTRAMNYLGYMWVDRGVRLQDARPLIEKAVAMEPKNAAYLDSMGWLLFKLDQPREALEYQLKAVELAQQPDPTLFDHLGDIYAEMEQLDKAREAWRKALEIEPNDEIQQKLERHSPTGP